MMVSESMVNRLLEIAEDLYYDYEVVAIRVQEPAFELGEINHVSRVWIDGEETNEELNGICCISSKYASKVFGGRFPVVYPGSHVAIIAGNHYEPGEDFGEVIISDPVVVDVVA